MHLIDTTPPLTIRPAGSDDIARLRRLAVLDSQPELSGPALIAAIADEPWAAVEVASRRTVADPFRASAGVAGLIRAHAESLRHA